MVSGCSGGDPLRPMPDMQTTKGRDVTNSLWVVLAATVHVGFSTLERRGNQNLSCRSLRRMGNHFVQFLRWVWQLQYMSASQRGCMATTASFAVQILVEWRGPHRPPGPSSFRLGRRSPCRREDGQRCCFVQCLHVDSVVRFQTCRSLMWSLCRDAVAGVCAV